MGAPKATASTPLNERQRRFVMAYCSGVCLFNATEAMRLAGYKGSDHVLSSQAYKALHRPHVAHAIRTELAGQFQVAELTISKVLGDLEQERRRALELGQIGAAVRASELHGKFLKLFTDRVEHVVTIEAATDAEILGLIKKLQGKIHGIGNLFDQVVGGDGRPETSLVVAVEGDGSSDGDGDS